MPNKQSDDELEQILCTLADIARKDGGFNLIPAVKEVLAALKARDARRDRNAKLTAIDEVFKMSPKGSFNQWRPTDALRFYERLRAYEQQLTQENQE